MDFGIPCTSLRKINTFFTKIRTFFSKQNQDSYLHYYDLYIPLGTLGKWFYTFPYLEMDFGTPCTSLRKISTFFIKIHTFFSRRIGTSTTHIMTYIFLWGPLKSDLRCFPTMKWTLENPTYILKKNKYILHKNAYKFFQEEPRPQSTLLWPIYSFGGSLESDLRCFPIPEMNFGISCTSLKKKYILYKNTCIFSKGNWHLNYPHYDLFILLETLKKWFEVFPQLEMDSRTPCRSLRKINTFFTKIHTFFSRGTKNPITYIMTYIFIWGPSRSDLRYSLIPKRTLEPHINP